MTPDFTRTVRRMVAENDRVPEQRAGSVGVVTLTLSEWLLARIAEDEAKVSGGAATVARN